MNPSRESTLGTIESELLESGNPPESQAQRGLVLHVGLRLSCSSEEILTERGEHLFQRLQLIAEHHKSRRARFGLGDIADTDAAAPDGRWRIPAIASL